MAIAARLSHRRSTKIDLGRALGDRIAPAVSQPDDLETLFERARALVIFGRDDDAMAVYIDMLRRDPTHFGALNEFGRLAHASGHRAAARTACEQAVRCHPGNPIGRVNLGNILAEEGEFAAALQHYKASLAADPGFPEAHRGMARILAGMGEEAAAQAHWHRSFAGQAIAEQRYRGCGPGVPMLLLVSAAGGNIPTRNILDDRVFAITVLYAEFHDPALPLPPHALLFNAIGDADLCADGLAQAQAVAARTMAPVVNHPLQVLATGRAQNAARLAGIPGVRAPLIRILPREALADTDLLFPLLLRTPGFHTGQHFTCVEHREGLAAAAAALPGEALLAIEYLDARGQDGLARKYRVMFIDGALYPVHLAISVDWKVHYFTAAMADNPDHRAEEQLFLENMEAVLGPAAVAALTAIGRSLGLDYAGIDFAIARDGAVLVFEANATMVINPPEAAPIWDYRRIPIARALQAAKQMLRAKSSGSTEEDSPNVPKT